jgi:hypothetical protein
MDDSKKLLGYWREASKWAIGEIGFSAVIFGTTGAVLAIIIAFHEGYVRKEDYAAMLSIAILGAIIALILEFFSRLLFLAPTKFRRDHLRENASLKADLIRISSVKSPKMLEIEWEQIDLGKQPLSAPNLRFDIINAGDISLDDVGVLVNQIEAEDSIDSGDAKSFPISLIPGANKRRLNPQERLTVAFGAVLISDPSYTKEKGPFAILRLTSIFGGLSNSYFSFRVEKSYKIRLTATAKDTKIPSADFCVSANSGAPDSECYRLRISKV